ncbi:MAG TPA: flagellar basal body rod protein FlgB [Anaerolineaceae bacterium]|nr:flagellar basal body rod protein FlgB [Anaerolineaceae bacterium]HPN52558.1 flagellar basal body rod protein FlgB [Anaerolineaceae bacterium]
MFDPIYGDASLTAAKAALDGLSLRRDLISQNLANTDTPGYRSQQVRFEDALNRAMNSTGRLALSTTHAGHQLSSNSLAQLYQVELRPGGTLRADGNNVDIDTEMTQMVETSLRYQTFSQAVSKKLALLKNIASTR